MQSWSPVSCSDTSGAVEGLRKTPKAQLTYERDFVFPAKDFSFLSGYSNEASSYGERTYNSTTVNNHSYTAVDISSNSSNAGTPSATKPTDSFISHPENDRSLNATKPESSSKGQNEDSVNGAVLSPEILWRLLNQEELKEIQQHKEQKYTKLLEADRSPRNGLKNREVSLEKLLIPSFVEESTADSVLQRKQQEFRVSEELRLQQLTNRIRGIVQREAEATELGKLRREEESQKLALLQDAIQRIDQATEQFQKTWKTLSEAVKSCASPEVLKPQITSRIVKLKELNQEFDGARREASNRDLCVNAAPRCEATVQEIKRLAEEVLQIVAEVNKQEQLKASAATTLPPPAASEHAVAIPAPDRVPAPSRDDFVRAENLEKYNELQSFLRDYEKSYATFVNNPALKQFRLDCQKAVITPANSISDVSASHLRDKYDKLQNLLQGSFVEVGEKRFCASHQQGGLEFCFDAVAKKFVKLAEDVVPSKPESCFAIAAVIVRLWIKFPVLGRLLLAHIYRACPYLLPRYIPQEENQSEEEFLKLQGYRIGDGPMEEQGKFLKRMSGTVRLLAAVMITPANQDHPFNIRHGWTFLADILNLPPRKDVTATVILSFLEVAGSTMAQSYGTQFQKALHLLCTDYFNAIKKVTPEGSSGPVFRLEEFLQTSIKRGGIPPPAGMLPNNFW